MKNALMIVREKKSALATVKQLEAYLKIQQKDYRLFWTTGYKGNLQEFRNESFSDAEEIHERIFTFSLRHGSDYISKEFFDYIIAREKYVFGGSGYQYALHNRCNPGELPIIRPVNDLAPLNLGEIDELFEYAERTKERRSKILYYHEKEQELSDKYKNLSNLSNCFPEQVKASLKSTGKKSLIIWNDSIDAAIIEPSFEYDLMTSKDIHYVGDVLSFGEGISIDFDNYGVIIISAELNLIRKKSKDDVGFTIPLQVEAGLSIACDLRLLKLRQPIIICSVQPQDDVRSRDALDFLAVPGGWFFDLESKFFNKPLPKNLQPISEYLLQDIIISHLTEGRLRQIIHDTGTRLLADAPEQILVSIVEDGFAAMKQFFTEKYLVHTSEINGIKDEILKNILSEGDGSMRKEYFEASKEKLRRLLAPKDNSELIEKPVGWNKVLYIEDNEMQREKVKVNFKEANIDCISVGSGEEAIELLKNIEKEIRKSENGRKPHRKRLNEIEKILKEGKKMEGHDTVEITPEERKIFEQEKLQLQPVIDKLNIEIQDKTRSFPPVIITDWRLLEDDGCNWQSMQGLDVIFEIASHPQEYFRPVSFLMLTDKNEGVLDMVKEPFPFQIRWHTKRNVGRSPADFMEFANSVIKEGNRMWDNWIELPSERWSEPYKSEGKKGTNNEGKLTVTFFYSMRDYFSQYLMKSDNEAQRMYINAKSLELLMYARLAQHGVSDGIPKEAKPILTSKLTNNSIDLDLIKFYPKLIGRRVFLALSEIDGYKSMAICALLFDGCILDDVIENSKKLAKPYIGRLSSYRATHLFLEDEDNKQLPEEKEWINELKNMQQDCHQRVISLFQNLRNKLAEIRDGKYSAKLIANRGRYINLFNEVELSTGHVFLDLADKITNTEEFAEARDTFSDLVCEIAKDRTTSGLLVNDYPELVEYCWNYELED